MCVLSFLAVHTYAIFRHCPGVSSDLPWTVTERQRAGTVPSTKAPQPTLPLGPMEVMAGGSGGLSGGALLGMTSEGSSPAFLPHLRACTESGLSR